MIKKYAYKLIFFVIPLLRTVTCCPRSTARPWRPPWRTPPRAPTSGWPGRITRPSSASTSPSCPPRSCGSSTRTRLWSGEASESLGEESWGLSGGERLRGKGKTRAERKRAWKCFFHCKLFWNFLIPGSLRFLGVVSGFTFVRFYAQFVVLYYLPLLHGLYGSRMFKCTYRSTFTEIL